MEEEATCWHQIWDFKGPLRPTLTLWFARHGRFLTNNLLFQRNICSSLECDICGASQILSFILFETVPKLAKFGGCLCNCGTTQAFFFLNEFYIQWIDQNLIGDWARDSSWVWKKIFQKGVHTLWKIRNRIRYSHTDSLEPISSVVTRIITRVEELDQAWIPDSITRVLDIGKF